MTPRRVRDLMTENVRTLNPEDDLLQVLEMIYEHHIRHIPVLDGDGDLLGLVTHRDLLRGSMIDESEMPLSLQREILQSRKVREVMTRDPEIVEPDTDLREAAQLMFEEKFGCLPVVEGSRLVGILTEADFVRSVARGG